MQLLSFFALDFCAGFLLTVVIGEGVVERFNVEESTYGADAASVIVYG
jgi:hypothetical protein